ncbi:UvrD-helicase domain-containing protein [Nocardiopsis sp. MG754419]|uniref:UvrD-helicase domain-containing protein n=1 Tax=Nocardiopsis sp. MG754419 TaxID=2259865 RepID=UPI001BA48B01|nr:UvrD-helicase domain-containing protein [Nocardiopsis sp. MG754419]MBR8744958.1 DNA helicase UvrD [Nocardiopsis sp. MG754419]
MPQLALGKQFFESGEYDELPPSARRNIRLAMEKFSLLTNAELKADKGLNFKNPKGRRSRSIFTFKVDNFYRGVVLAPESGDSYLLLKVLPHDPAYDWAIKQDAGVNRLTGSVEIWDAEGLERLTPGLEERAAPTDPEQRLLARVSDGDLTALGISDKVLRAARTAVDSGELTDIVPFLPEDQAEVLQYLAAGFTVEEVWRDIVAHRPSGAVSDDLDTAIRNTPTRVRLVSGLDELEEILSQPFAAWRTFLHPAQRKVAYKASYPGSYQVTGGPGTGKTVVAMHRVEHLLTYLRPDERIWLTTFTNTLATALGAGVRQLVDDPPQLDRLDITTVNSQASKVLTEAGGGRAPRFISDSQELDRWRGIVRDQGLEWTAEFLQQEYRHVVLAQRLDTLEQYQAATRSGRGSRLAAAQRERVWKAVTAFGEGLDADGVQTHLRGCDLAARILQERGPRFRHVVVDEAQDLHPAQWRFLRAAVAPAPDDLFISGDPHQRIYDAKVSLKTLGINVVGRSQRLRRNYRSTQQILTWSRPLLDGEKVESLADGGTESLAGYRSALQGPAPTTHAADDLNGELDALVDRVRDWIEAGIEPSSVAVAVRAGWVGKKAVTALNGAGIDTCGLREADDDTPGVRVGTMHSLKGLEFRCVAALGVADGSVPNPKAITPHEVDELQHRADMMAERCLLFVVCTRARDHLHVSWHGKPSPFLAEAGIA